MLAEEYDSSYACRAATAAPLPVPYIGHSNTIVNPTSLHPYPLPYVNVRRNWLAMRKLASRYKTLGDQ